MIKKWIQENLISNGKLNSRRLSKDWFDKNGFSDYYTLIYENTNFLNDDCKFSQRIWHSFYEIYENITCKCCDSLTRFVKFSIGYKTYCSMKCVGLDENLKTKRQKTCLKNYGVDNPSKSDIIKKKKENTCLENHGVEYTLQSNRLRKQIIEKVKLNNGITEDIDNISQIESIKEKVKQTHTEKYGGFTFESDELKEKVRSTILKKYGVEHPLKNDNIKKKVIDTKLNRYGVETIGKFEPLSKEYWLSCTFFGCKIDSIQKLPQQWSKQSGKKFKIKCSCGKIWTPRFADFISGKSISCGHNVGTSYAEQEIFSFIRDSLNIYCENRYKIKGVEFDIYIPEKRIAIEYHGLIWHSEKFSNDKRKDYKKYKFCKENNIRYMSIYEDEWINNKNFVKDFIKNCIGINTKYTVRPQKLYIVYEGTGCSRTEIKNFLNKYHYAGGNTTFQHVWKCYYNKVLIAILGIGSPTRQTIKEEYELKRVCIHPDYKCYGLWSYLFKNYVNKILYNSIITSYSDNRRDTGNLYKHVGFSKIHEVPPDYFWIKNQKRFHKSSFRKTDIIKKSGLTEKEYWEHEGYVRLWDCGKTKWNLILK